MINTITLANTRLDKLSFFAVSSSFVSLHLFISFRHYCCYLLFYVAYIPIILVLEKRVIYSLESVEVPTHTHSYSVATNFHLELLEKSAREIKGRH